ncbi:unnamed protein product [Auanema sp. JU1783]|nr:unnamed protein product [Auanema sp. JU1783]
MLHFIECGYDNINPTTNLADNNYSRATYNRWNDNYQTIDNNRKQNDKFVKNKYEFSNLFNQLKAQFMDIVDKQDTLRQRLSVANQEFYSLEMSAAAKKGIIDAWEKQGGGRTAESIERLKSEVEDINQKLMELNKSRNLLEKSVVKGHEISSQIEIRLRALATTREQKELIELLVRMSSVRAEKMTAVNDLALKSILLDKADTSMMKLHKYESIAEKLIEGGLDGISIAIIYFNSLILS